MHSTSYFSIGIHSAATVSSQTHPRDASQTSQNSFAEGVVASGNLRQPIQLPTHDNSNFLQALGASSTTFNFDDFKNRPVEDIIDTYLSNEQQLPPTHIPSPTLETANSTLNSTRASNITNRPNKTLGASSTTFNFDDFKNRPVEDIIDAYIFNEQQSPPANIASPAPGTANSTLNSTKASNITNRSNKKRLQSVEPPPTTKPSLLLDLLHTSKKKENPPPSESILLQYLREPSQKSNSDNKATRKHVPTLRKSNKFSPARIDNSSTSHANQSQQLPKTKRGKISTHSDSPDVPIIDLVSPTQVNTDQTDNIS